MGDSSSRKILEKKRKEKKITLGIVLLISIFICIIEFKVGLSSNSVSLIAHSLHILENITGNRLNFVVFSFSQRTQAKLSCAKGFIMMLITIFIFSRAFSQLLFQIIPNTKTMSLITIIVLVANYICLIILTKFTQKNSKILSFRLIFKNNIIINILILITAGLVAITNSPIADIITALILTIFIAKSTISVLFLSLKKLY